jgi:hypothetical protein
LALRHFVLEGSNCVSESKDDVLEKFELGLLNSWGGWWKGWSLLLFVGELNRVELWAAWLHTTLLLWLRKVQDGH